MSLPFATLYLLRIIASVALGLLVQCQICVYLVSYRRSGDSQLHKGSTGPGESGSVCYHWSPCISARCLHMRQYFITVPTKLSVFALHRSLRRQARLLPHEYLRYHPLFCMQCSDFEPVTYYRQFFYLRLSTSIRSALDASRKDKQRLGTLKRLRKVVPALFAIAFTDPPSLGECSRRSSQH